MSNNFETSSSLGWFWIKNKKSTQNKGDITNSTRNRGSITGKYLFFSDDKNELIELAKDVLEKYDLAIAKTPSSNIPNSSEGFGFVLCVYDVENRFCEELKKLENDSISFRYWKSDKSTRAGLYSQKFKDSQKYKNRKK